MPFKDRNQRNLYFKEYMRQRRQGQPRADQDQDDALPPPHDGTSLNPPSLDRSKPWTEIPRPYPHSVLAEQDGRVFDLLTGVLHDEINIPQLDRSRPIAMVYGPGLRCLLQDGQLFTLDGSYLKREHDHLD
jgi:hypothetical protein